MTSQHFLIKVESRVRCTYRKGPSLRQHSDELEQHLVSSAELTVHVTLSRTDEGLGTYETVNDCKEDYTYATVEKNNRKLGSDRGKGLNTKEGEEKQARSTDGCCIPSDNLQDLDPDATKNSETHEEVGIITEKQHENKEHVYAVVNKYGKGKVSGSSFKAKTKRSLKDGTPLDPENRLSSVNSVNRLSVVQPGVRLSSVDPVNRSSLVTETGRNNTDDAADKDGPAGEDKKDYVYAVVDKANKKRKPPQMPSPYRGLVYADLSHHPAGNKGPVKKGLPTIYADIDHLKTDASSSKIPEENLDQATKDDGP